MIMLGKILQKFRKMKMVPKHRVYKELPSVIKICLLTIFNIPVFLEHSPRNSHREVKKNTLQKFHVDYKSPITSKNCHLYILYFHLTAKQFLIALIGTISFMKAE